MESTENVKNGIAKDLGYLNGVPGYNEVLATEKKRLLDRKKTLQIEMNQLDAQIDLLKKIEDTVQVCGKEVSDVTTEQ